jgi:hypothetical protein
MRISRTTGAFSGLLLVILGIWGGIAPFIGPSFGYAFGTHATWYYTADRLYLDILPGVAVIFGGLILFRAGNRASGVLGSWLAIAGGAWFVTGPAVSRLWERTLGPIGGPLFGNTRRTVELLGTFYGLGALIIALAAFALGRVVSRPALVVAEPAAAEPAAAQPVTPEPASSKDEEHSIPAVDAPYQPAHDSADSEHVTTGSVAGAL